MRVAVSGYTPNDCLPIHQYLGKAQFVMGPAWQHGFTVPAISNPAFWECDVNTKFAQAVKQWEDSVNSVHGHNIAYTANPLELIFRLTLFAQHQKLAVGVNGTPIWPAPNFLEMTRLAFLTTLSSVDALIIADGDQHDHSSMLWRLVMDGALSHGFRGLDPDIIEGMNERIYHVDVTAGPALLTSGLNSVLNNTFMLCVENRIETRYPGRSKKGWRS